MGCTIPTLDNGCFCLSLKTGTIIIAIFNMITGFMAALFAISFLAQKKLFEAYGVRIWFNYKGTILMDLNLLNVMQATGALVLMISILYIISASLLIHGARKGRPGLMTPWLLLTCVIMVVQAISIFIFLANIMKTVNILYFLGTVAGLVIEAYSLVLVDSLRKHPQDEEVEVSAKA